MTRYPGKDRHARTGSSLAGRPVREYREAQLNADTRLHQRLAREHHRLTRTLFSKADLRRAAEIAREVNREWREASLGTGGDAARVATLKQSARRKLDRMLVRELANYRQWKTLQRAHLRAQDRLAKSTLASHRAADFSIHWGDLAVVDPATRQFVAPFTTFDVQTIDFGNFVVFDESFARPSIGHLVNNFVFDQDESTSIGAGLLGILPIVNAVSMVSCGVSFTTPSAGRLRIDAELGNLYNKVVFAVEDKFGFSSANVGIALCLFVAVVRGTRVEHKSQVLLHTGLNSDGSDLTYVQSDLDTSVPYTISVETATRLDANESVLVLAGSEVFMGTKLDDMHCKMNAVLWWELRKLAIGMAQDVIT